MGSLTACEACDLAMCNTPPALSRLLIHWPMRLSAAHDAAQHKQSVAQVAAAAVGLQLSALCEQLGLSAAASEWLQLATPERWPTPEQLQCAEASMGVQQLTQDLLLQANSSSGVAAAASGGAATAGGNRSPAAAHQTAFLVEALQGVEPATLRAWQQACPQHDDNNTTNSHSSSSSTHSRPRSAAGVGAAAAAAAAASLASSRAGSNSNAYPQAVAGKLLQLKPRVDVECWVSIARYWVDHAQYTAGQKMCGLALQVARCDQQAVVVHACMCGNLCELSSNGVSHTNDFQAVDIDCPWTLHLCRVWVSVAGLLETAAGRQRCCCFKPTSRCWRSTMSTLWSSHRLLTARERRTQL